MKASLSGFLTVSASAVLAYATVRFGHSITYTQMVDPYVGGILWPISVIGVLMTFFVGVVVIFAILLEIIEGVRVPMLYGRSTCTLVGSGGLLGTGVGVAGILHNWSTTAGITPPWESIVAAALVVVPSAYAYYLLWRPEDLIRTFSVTNESASEPEFVRDKTAQWSDKETERQSTPKPTVTQRQLLSNDTKREPPQKHRSDQNQGVDFSELEFDWTTDTGIDFEDVGGMAEVKRALERDVIKPLTTHREKAEELGVSPTNLILHGPPGTGKTFAAKALATELGLPFAKLSGADVQSKWINESSQKVKALFEEAEVVAEDAGGALVFFDELDSVLKSRGAVQAHEEDTKVVNEFLNRLENTDEHNIVFVGATNRLESLDEAGTRSGRIDKKIHIGMPDFEARMSILKVQLNDRPHCLTEEQIGAIAERTEGMTAADLTSLVESAARNSLFDRGGDTVTHIDMHQALND